MLQETGSSTLLWLQQEYGQSPDKAEQERRNLVLLCGPCISTFGKLDEQTDTEQRQCRSSQLLTKTLMGLAPDQSP